MNSACQPGVSVTADANAMAEIHAASFADPWSALFFTSLLNQPGVTALAAGANPMHGFIVVRQAADEAEILTFAVSPAHRGQGIGSILIKAALVLMMAQKAARCFLEVAEDNAAAISVYTTAGFRRCGVRKDYYRRGANNMNAVIMERLWPC